MKHALLLVFSVVIGTVAHAQYVTTFPFTEDFEASATCGTGCGNACVITNSEFTNDLGDDRDWTVDANGTGSGGTGPTANGGADHNPGVAGGQYLYTETSGACSGGDVSNLVSPYFDFTNINVPYVRFWFHMFGGDMGDMHFDIDTTQGQGAWVNDYIPSWTDDVDEWQQRLVSLVEFGGMDSVRFRVRGVSGTSFESDMAVDDFYVNDTVFSVLADVFQPQCDGDNSGLIVASGLFGVEPFTYSWSTSSTNDSINVTDNTTYGVTVTDANGLTATASFTTVDVPAINTSTTVIQDLVCKYDDAIATVSASGGTPLLGAYTQDTTSANFDPDTTTANDTIVNLGDDAVSPFFPIGFPFVFFGDTFNDFRIVSNGFITFDPGSNGSGCCSGQNFPNPALSNAVIALNWEDLDPDNGNDGTISYKTVGTAPFRRLIVKFEDVPYFGGSVGDVTVQAMIYETTNCVEIHTIDVVSDGTQTQGIENLAGDEGYTYPGRNAASWSGQGDYIAFCPPVGGFSYLWSNGSIDTIAEGGLTPGINYVTVTDGNGCEVVDSVDIQSLSNLDLSPMISDISCFGLTDGMIASNAANGVAPYTYVWSDASTNDDLTGAGAGTYGVTVTDDLNCVDSINGLTIVEPPLLVSSLIDITSSTCPDSADGSAAMIAAGGTPPYTYTWLPDGLSGASVFGLTSGSYQGVVEDSNGCQSIQSVTVLSEFPSPNPDLGPDVANTSGAAVTLNPGNFATYAWNGGATSSTLQVTQTGTYSVEVTNAFGCAGTDTVFVEIWPLGISSINGGEGVNIFPNPVQESLTVSLEGLQVSSELEVIVTNLQGQVLSMQTAVSGTRFVVVDTEELASGVYNLHVRGEEIDVHQRFVRQ